MRLNEGSKFRDVQSVPLSSSFLSRRHLLLPASRSFAMRAVSFIVCTLDRWDAAGKTDVALLFAAVVVATVAVAVAAAGVSVAAVVVATAAVAVAAAGVFVVAVPAELSAAAVVATVAAAVPFVVAVLAELSAVVVATVAAEALFAAAVPVTVVANLHRERLSQAVYWDLSVRIAG